MASFLSWITLSILIVGAPQLPAEKQSPGWGLWKQGQDALSREQTDKAIDLFEESLAADPRLTRNYLSLAAAHLDRNDEAKACTYLMLYVAAHPEHLAVRLQYADLLQRLKRVSEARSELESMIADMQEKPRSDEQLLQCHSKLMQLAEKTENEYEEHLHRGIGLFLLARQHIEPLNDPDMLCPQGLLCKAAGELTLAARARPNEARPHYYLHQVWSRLLQSQPAGKSLRAAESAAPFSYLTPTEQRQLQLASRERERMTTRR
jgi:tetratricopeptide (TPR) repeat protein